MGIEIDHGARRVNMKATAGLSGTAISKATARMLETDPRTASYDFVMDVRDSPTGATQADLQIVLDAYHRQTREPGLKYGCYVSNDPNYRLWTASMDHLFGDRENLVFTTPEAAHAFLDEKRCVAAA